MALYTSCVHPEVKTTDKRATTPGQNLFPLHSRIPDDRQFFHFAGAIRDQDAGDIRLLAFTSFQPYPTPRFLGAIVGDFANTIERLILSLTLSSLQTLRSLTEMFSSLSSVCSLCFFFSTTVFLPDGYYAILAPNR